MSIPAEIVGNGQSGTDIQSFESHTLDFASLREKAMAFGSDTPVTEQVTPEQPAEVVAETPTTDVTNASASKLASLADDALVELTVDGEKVTMPWSEAKNGFQRQAKFTREMQQLRREQEQFQTQAQATAAQNQLLQQQHASMAAVIKDPALLKQLVEQAYPDLFAAANGQLDGQFDPNDIATVGQVHAAVAEAKQQLAKIQQELKQDLATRQQAIQQEISDREDLHATAKLSTDINATIKSLFSEHPYLEQVVPQADQMLRWQVSQLHPRTPEETLEAFKTVAGGWVENYNKAVASHNKQAVIQKQKLKDNNIQPSGGASLQQQPVTQVPKDAKGQIDWKALRARAEGMLT